MSTLLICPSGAVAQVLDRLGFAGESPSDDVTIVTWAAPDVSPAPSRQIVTVGRAPGRLGATASRVLSRGVVGRNILRITPWDGGRRLARAALRDVRVRRAAASADLIVAVERDGILTAWTASRRWGRASGHAVYGVAAANALRRERPTS